MSILDKIVKGQRARAQKVVIYAPEGFGKSTIASQFPDPLFLDVEDSTSQMNVARLTREDLPTLDAVEEALSDIKKTKPCATLVVDTIDWLEYLIVDALIKGANSSSIKAIGDFPHGTGYDKLSTRATVVLSKFDGIIQAGIHVLLLAHAKIVKFEPPDGAGAYDTYEMKLGKRVGPLVVEWADMMIFGNYRTQVKENDKEKKYKGVGGKERLMHCGRTASWRAKNRHGMADTEKWDIGVVEQAFRRVGAPWGAIRAKPEDALEQVADGESPAADGVAMPPPQHSYNLSEICAPIEDDVNAYLVSNKKITHGQTWRAITDEAYIARILKNADAFERAVKARKA
jgi:hypothetical protein